MTITQYTQDLQNRVKAHLDDTWSYALLNSLPAIDADPEEIGAATVFKNITDKASYLAWVAQYRTLINEIETQIRALKAQRFNKDIYIRSTAESQAQWFARDATVLIHLRRLGKIWSADQAKKRFDTAA